MNKKESKLKAIYLWLPLCALIAGCQREADPVKQAAPPPEMRAAVADAYRLAPDQRALRAVADIHRIHAAREAQPVGFAFSGTGWRIHYGPDEIGQVPELPTYADLRKLLAGIAGRLQPPAPPASAQTPASRAEIERGIRAFFASEALPAARLASAAWQSGERDAGLLRLAAQAQIALCLQSFDTLDIAEALPVRALALLALHAAAGGAELTREHALLAGLLGYETEARALAQTLPADDPARAFVEGDEAALQRIAQAPDATPEARYLLLSHLGRKRQLEAALQFQARSFPAVAGELPWFKTILETHNFAVTESTALFLPYAVLITLEKDAPEKRWLPMITTGPRTEKEAAGFKMAIDKFRERHGIVDGNLSIPFEKELEARAQETSGALFDAEMLRAFYRGYFYSALDRLGRHYLESRSSLPEAHSFAASLHAAPTGPGAEYKRWYSSLSQVSAGAANADVLLVELDKITALGGSPLARTFHLYTRSAPFGSVRVMVAARRLAARLDSRPLHRQLLGGVAFASLMDLPLTERLYDSAVSASPHAFSATRAFLALFNGNSEEVTRLIASAEGDPDEYFDTLNYLAISPETDPKLLAGAFQALIARWPESWKYRRGMVELLERTGDYAKARAVILEWLKVGKSSGVFDEVVARTALARLYEREGRYAEGLDAVWPVVQSWQSGAMERAALLLARAGHREEADKLSAAVVDRYPNSLRTLLVRAQLLWMDGRFDEAAALFKAHRNPISTYEWRFTVAKALQETFDKTQGGAAQAAFMALHAAKIDAFSLLELARAAADDGRAQLAFEMASVLRTQGLGQLEMTITAYNALKKWKGQAEAVSWIRKLLPPPLINPLSMFAFRSNDSELLWDLVGATPSGQGADFVWLMRAALAKRQGLANDPNREALEGYYKGSYYDQIGRYLLGMLPDGLKRYFKSTQNSYYDQIGRYLLGGLPEDELLALATTPKLKCEIAFYAGLRAESEHRFRDASDWYRVALETGQSNNGEWRWAYDQLYRWYSGGRSLALLEKSGV